MPFSQSSGASPPLLALPLQVVGVAFPIPIMALVPLRQFVLPRLFDPKHLAELDRASYEELPALNHELAARVSGWEPGGDGTCLGRQAGLTARAASVRISLIILSCDQRGL